MSSAVSEPPNPRVRIAFIDFAEVSVGFAVALVMSEVWTERDATTKKPGNDVRWGN
jgi:hypothetical protein